MSSSSEDDLETSQPQRPPKDQAALALSCSLSPVMAPAMWDSSDSSASDHSIIRASTPRPGALGPKTSRGPRLGAPGPSTSRGPRPARTTTHEEEDDDDDDDDEEDIAAQLVPEPARLRKKGALELSRALSPVVAAVPSDSSDSSAPRRRAPGPSPSRGPRRAELDPVTRDSESSSPGPQAGGPHKAKRRAVISDSESSSRSKDQPRSGSPLRAKRVSVRAKRVPVRAKRVPVKAKRVPVRAKRVRRRNYSTTPEEEEEEEEEVEEEGDNVVQPVPEPAKRLPTMKKRARRVWRLRTQWRTEWPLVDGKDPLVEEILAEIRTPRRPHDNTKYQIPVRPKLPSTAELLFDALLAESAPPNPPTPSLSPTPTPMPSPSSTAAQSVGSWEEFPGPDWTRSICPWLLPLDADVNAHVDADEESNF